jgi:hypothetical protein
MTAPKTLSAAHPKVTLTGHINAYGSIGTYTINTGAGPALETIDAAVFGPATTHFTVHNTGTITSRGTSPFDAGIALGAAGTVFNTGNIDSATDIAIFGTKGVSAVKNTGGLYASVGVAIYTEMAADITNDDFIYGKQNGIVLGGGGTLVNQATASGALAGGRISAGYYFGVLAEASATVINSGSIYGYAGGLDLKAGGDVNNSGRIFQFLPEVAQFYPLASNAAIELNATGTVSNSGTLYGSNGIKFHGAAPGTATISNTGLISAASTISITGAYLPGFFNYGVGIYSNIAGSVNNQGTIYGDHFGIFFKAAASATNSGLISSSPGYGVGLDAGGSLTNTGTIYGFAGGIFLLEFASGGGAPAYISNSGRVAAGKPGGNSAAIGQDAPGTIRNSGIVTDPNGTGIILNATLLGDFGYYNGAIINTGTVAARYGMIFGGVGGVTNTGSVISQDIGVKINSTHGQVYNSGVINADGTTFSNAYGTYAATGVFLREGGSATNAATGTIIGGVGIDAWAYASYADNAGTITAGTIGVVLQTGGTVKNAGLITAGETGIDVKSGGTVSNTGTILATGFADGIYIGGTTASAYNGKTGFISADTGILLFAPGDVTNAGSIESTFGNGIFLFDGGTVTNSGFISETDPLFGGGVGIVLNDGGVIDNTGTVYGAGVGIDVSQGGTIIDSGSIASGFRYAIFFYAGSAAESRLILSPTAHFTGTVQLNGGALNLAADGKKIGTFAPENLQILNAGSITIDSGAIWDIAGTFTNGSTGILVNDGTIKESAHDLIDFNGPITGTGVIELSKETLTFNGAVASTQKISFSGTGEDLALGDAAKFAAKIEQFALGDTIDLTSIALSAITATHFASGVLTLDEGAAKLEFTFANPATFGTDIFALSATGQGTAITLAAPGGAMLPVTHVTTLGPLATFGS